MVISTREPVAEILEENAEGAVKTLYEDVRLTYRVPVVDGLFRALAAQNLDYLQVAWRALKPNLRTIFFETRSDALRRFAVERVRTISPRIELVGEKDMTNRLLVFHYINAKMLLSVTVLRSASAGQVPKLQELGSDEKRQLPVGLVEGAPVIAPGYSASLNERAVGILDDIEDTLGLSTWNTEYRAFADSPDYLATAWHSLKPVVQLPEYERAATALARNAQLAVTSLPFRMELNPHTLRHCGLSEQDIDGVRSLLDRVYDLLLTRVLNVAVLTCARIGEEAATPSPYPVASV